MAPEYKKAAKNLDGIVKIAAIDCDQERELCGAFQIKGFPTIKVFPSKLGKKEGRPWKEPIDYQGKFFFFFVFFVCFIFFFNTFKKKKKNSKKKN